MDRLSLEDAILVLEGIIDDASAKEPDFQKWFEDHPVVGELLL
jgi:hypothetical protein